MGEQLDFAGVAGAADVSAVVKHLLPDGTLKGGEWFARNPRREDKRAGSFSVNVRTGQWQDRAAPEHRGGDVVSLWAFVRGVDQGTAAREVAAFSGVDHLTAPTRVVKLDEHKPVIVSPVPDYASPPTWRHGQHGDPTHKWPYYDEHGRVILYVCRFDHPDGSKDIISRSWCRFPDGTERWAWKGISGSSRPLYGIDRLAANRSSPVIIVEGEKTAEAAQAIAGDAYVVVSWLGGSSTAGKVAPRDHLTGRDVYLWPDYDAKTGSGGLLPKVDQPGMKAMLQLAAVLGERPRSLRIIDYEPGEADDGWDIADAKAWSVLDLRAQLDQRSRTPAQITGADRQDNARPLDLDVPLPAFEPWPQPNMKLKPKGTIRNLEHMLSRYGVRPAYNEMSKKIELPIPGQRFDPGNLENCQLAVVEDLAAVNEFPKMKVEGPLLHIADGNRYHPVRRWLEEARWDGVNRFGEFADTLVLRNPELEDIKRALLWRWLISAVAAVYEPDGIRAQGVLVLAGEQGIGKSTWLQNLAPASLQAVGEGMSLDPANKDSVFTAMGYWIVELGEIDGTFRKADIARLKAFITNKSDRLRRPYAKADSFLPRRTVFAGSVNTDRYLVDDTGNRRWWSVNLQAIRAYHDVDMQQLWAQVADAYHSGDQWHLTMDESAALEQANEEHQAIEPIEEMLLETFKFGDEITKYDVSDRYSATTALQLAGKREPSQRDANKASVILRKLTGQEPRKSNGVRGFDLVIRRT